MVIKFFAPALVCLLLSACMMGPDFVPPESVALSRWDRADIPDAASQTLENESLDAQWWHSLHDPLLDTLIAQIASQNFDVRIATERLDQSRAQRGITAAGLFPKINGDASYTREKLSDKGVIDLVGSGGGGNGAASAGVVGAAMAGVPSTSTTPAFNVYQYGFDASWELDLWGKVRRGVEAADANVDASAEARRGLVLSSIAELVRDYVQLRGTQADLALARINLKTANDMAALSASRAHAGLSSESDVATAKAQAASADAQLPLLAQQQNALMNAIALLLGKPPGALDTELAAVRPIPPLPARVPIGVPSELARRRPDIREAEAQLHAATAEIGVAKAQFFPDVTLTGNGMLQALNTSDLNSWAARTYSFGPAVTLPIFQGGQLISNLKLSKAEEREAAINYQKTLLNAFHEVDNALTNFRAAQQHHVALAMTVTHDRDVLKLATSCYQNGLSDDLEVLSAQQNLLAAQQQETQSARDETIAMAQLYKALGGGWETDFPVMPVK